jgi:hypothetical protein
MGVVETLALMALSSHFLFKNAVDKGDRMSFGAHGYSS